MARPVKQRRLPGAVTPVARQRLSGFPTPIILLGALALAILLLPLLRGGGAEEEGQPDGYASIVSAALQQNWLYPVTDSPGQSGDVDGRVERARVETIPASFDRFIATSFLREDMTTLDPAIWRYDGTRLELDPRAHLISGAYGGSSGWRGSILYADREVEQRLVDDRGGPPALLVSPRSGVPSRMRTINLMGAAPAGQPGAATDIAFVAAVDGVPTAIASLRRIGDHALLRVPRRDRAAVGVTVGGEEAAPAGAYQIGWRLLVSGDALIFSWPGGSRRFQFIENRPAISRARGDAVRVRDASLDNFARPIEAAVGGGNQSLETSLLSRVQASSATMLAERSMALYGSEGITSFRSAAVLMDGLTGEIAALPSFPVIPDHLHPSQRNSPAHRRMLERNSNFVRMVVGSTAKAPFALAILNSFPQLGQLRISATTPFRTLAGVDLGTPVPDHGSGTFDFRTFLARSSNKYAAMLMVLGLSDAQSIARNACDGPSNERFWIGDQARTCRPRMAFLDGARPTPLGMRPVRAGRPAGQGWSNNLYTLFCLSPNGPDEQPPTPDIGCMADEAQRRAIWRSAQFERPRLLAAVSPDREGFGLNVVDGVYEDYVMSILGGNRGRWSTISLAQAYARIITGRAITARLTRQGSAAGEEEPQAVRLQLNQGAHNQVVQGLRAVVLEGTGRSLSGAGFPAGADGDEFRIFAKTGTPNVAFLGDDARLLLQQFAASGCGLRLVQRAPRPGAPARNELAVGDDPALPVAQAIRAREDCQGRFGASAQRLTELIRTLNQNATALAQVRADASGRVTDIPPQVTLGEGTGHLLVVLVGRYRPGTPDTQPCSLRVAAINFQARTGQNRIPALGYAVALLQGEATRDWFMGARCPASQPAAAPRPTT